MSFWSATLAAAGRVLGFTLASEAASGDAGPAHRISTAIARQESAPGVAAALTLSTVYRAVQIHATAASQLSIKVERDGFGVTTPSLVRQPCLSMSRSAWMEYLTTSLYTRGEAFLRVVRSGPGSRTPGQAVELIPVNPGEVGVHQHRSRNGDDLPDSYTWRGRTFTSSDMLHLKLLRIPGTVRGLGPIQAAAAEIRGALDARDYGASWLSETGIPEGVLTTDQELNATQAKQTKDNWYGIGPDGEPEPDHDGRKVRVLGKGTRFEPLLLKPSEVQFLESQQFSTTQIARLFAIPASLMLAAVQGDSQTYANVSQYEIGYVRFGLMAALREIEEAVTSVLPRGQEARVNLDALLRADTKTRYDAHKVGLDAGFLDVDEVREIEGLPPLTDEQRARAAARTPAAQPTPEATND
ncbi:phage portal protein [Mycetocola reblochoni]|uniref:phage portal protein n=1 Tax=Mycetocola reblochoni TaxID=331618 RepID=UPI003F978245